MEKLKIIPKGIQNPQIGTNELAFFKHLNFLNKLIARRPNIWWRHDISVKSENAIQVREHFEKSLHKYENLLTGITGEMDANQRQQMAGRWRADACL